MHQENIQVHRLAILKVRKAYRWYQRRSTTAAKRFQTTFEAMIERISRSPESLQPHHHGTRFGKLRKFPFLLIFEAVGTTIRILAVRHKSRKPGAWLLRRKRTI